MDDLFSATFTLTSGDVFWIALAVLVVAVLVIRGFRSRDSELQQLSEKLAKLQRQELDDPAASRRLDLREAAFNRILEDKKQTAPWLAGLWAEYEEYSDLHRSAGLRANATHAKLLVKELRKEKRELIFANRALLHQLNYDLSLFPWLAQYHELTPEDGLRAAQEAAAASDDEAAAKEESLWLAPAEYAALPEAEKYQRALERYLARPRSDWQAGRDYERYIGYLYEKAGYTVRYTGATQGLGDMGRDLIASKDGAVDIVQCKRWKVGKQIRENAIFQLVGTTAMYKKEHPSLSVRPVFVTTASLSEEAQICADYLHVTVRQNLPLADYPQIKCNVGKDGEKYYHLPFFQRYDVTMISYADGDMYCSTVQEAIDAGFIRAKRWLPDS